MIHLMMKGAIIMRELYWLSSDQLKLIEPYFPRSRGVSRVDDLRVISGIIFVLKRGLQWRDAPSQYGPHKTLYNRFIRWSRLGVFDQIFAALASQDGPPDQVQIDATHLKAHRTAASLLKKGMFPVLLGAQKAA
jgi:transposase